MINIFSNLTQNETTCDTNELKVSLINSVILPVISVFGVVLSLFSVLVFDKIIRTIRIDSHMFKYLQAKSINDTFIFLIQLLSVIYFCFECDLMNSSLAGTIYYTIYIYAQLPFLMGSSLMEVLATFDFYCLISKKLKFVHSKFFFIIAITISHAYGIIFYLPYAFFNDIIENKLVDNSLKTYRVKKNNFYHSVYGKSIKLMSSFQRDFFILILLVILNLFIAYEFVKYLNRKKSLGNYRHSNRLNESKPILSNAEKLINNQFFVMLSVALNHLLGHITLVYGNTFFLIYMKTPCNDQIAWILLISSYATNVIFFYMFNKNFKKISNKFIYKFCCWLTIFEC
jgi:hypothetical protein